MDSGIIIMGVFLLLIFILPVVLLNKSRSNRKKQFVKDLFALAGKDNNHITEHDLWNNTIIGIDKDAHKIFFIRKTTNNEVSMKINLSEVERCRIIDTIRNEDNKVNNEKIFEKLELILTYREKKDPDKVLEFYKNDYDSPKLRGELQLIQKWSGIVEAELMQLASKKR